MYLIFSTKNKAETANSLISQNMGLTGDITLKWADVVETQSSEFAILKPDENFMSNVSDFFEQENILTNNITQEI